MTEKEMQTIILDLKRFIEARSGGLADDVPASIKWADSRGHEWKKTQGGQQLLIHIADTADGTICIKVNPQYVEGIEYELQYISLAIPWSMLKRTGMLFLG